MLHLSSDTLEHAKFQIHKKKKTINALSIASEEACLNGWKSSSFRSCLGDVIYFFYPKKITIKGPHSLMVLSFKKNMTAALNFKCLTWFSVQIHNSQLTV